MRIEQLNLQDEDTARRILAIQHAAYAIEAELIGTTNIPPLNDTLATLQASDEAFYGCMIEDEIAGIVACTVEDGTLDICRMAVHPDYFRRGIARALLTFVQAAHPTVHRAIVSTGARNEPAKTLYVRDGFTHIEDREVEAGVWLSFFEKGF
jgi:ribosomal protein S18 acetylase RimI-like enzyme